MQKKPSLAKSVWRTIYPTLSRVPLVRHALQWRNTLLHRRSDPHTVSTYLSSCRKAGLHLGCGPHILAGWLNTDLHAIRPDVVCVDVTKRFPFGDNLFDYVFTEHMIEHLCFADARNAITESFRVLKPGGRIRVSTPDLAFLCSLKESGLSADRSRYIKWSCSEYLNTPLANAAVTINNFVRNWGHQFIFDKETLTWALQDAGFHKVTFHQSLVSDDTHLQNLENTSRLPDGFVALESMCAQATKPGGAHA